MFINAKMHTFHLLVIKGDTYPKVPLTINKSNVCISGLIKVKISFQKLKKMSVFLSICVNTCMLSVHTSSAFSKI